MRVTRDENRYARHVFNTKYSGTAVGDARCTRKSFRRAKLRTADCTALFDKPVASAMRWWLA